MSVVSLSKLAGLLVVGVAASFVAPAFADVNNSTHCQGSYSTTNVRTMYGYLSNTSGSTQYITCPVHVPSAVATIAPVVEVRSVAATTSCYLRTRSRTGLAGSYASRSVSGSGDKSMAFSSMSVSSLYTYALDCTIPNGGYVWQYRY